MKTPTAEEVVRAYSYYAINKWTGRTIKKQNLRDILEVGTHECSLEFSATIDNNEFRDRIDVGDLIIDHDSSSSSTVTPEVSKLLTYVLSHLNSTTRNKILENLVIDYVNQNLEERVSKHTDLLESVNMVLGNLRSNIVVPRRGDVKFNLPLLPPPNLDLSVLNLHPSGESS